MRGVHDLGGQPAGAIDRSEHELTFFDKQVDAMNTLLGGGGKRIYTTDEHRRAIESLPPEQYQHLTYYERWVLGLKILAVEKGLVTEAEIARRVAEIERRQPSGGAGANKGGT
ncbi:MAG: nitrile hydratase subunit beta [Candidatus Lambdaproteobacteria bacterium]|nr:nitrile hydratase subunit beta [Candidatus Lambdaproteobacteria bacterium]